MHVHQHSPNSFIASALRGVNSPFMTLSSRVRGNPARNSTTGLKAHLQPCPETGAYSARWQGRVTMAVRRRTSDGWAGARACRCRRDVMRTTRGSRCVNLRGLHDKQCLRSAIRTQRTDWFWKQSHKCWFGSKQSSDLMLLCTRPETEESVAKASIRGKKLLLFGACGARCDPSREDVVAATTS